MSDDNPCQLEELTVAEPYPTIQSSSQCAFDRRRHVARVRVVECIRHSSLQRHARQPFTSNPHNKCGMLVGSPADGTRKPGRTSVARYAYPSIDNLPEPLAKEIRARVTPGRGNVWRMLLWSPDTAQKFIEYSEEVRHRNAIPPQIRELMILRTGHLCDAAYEVHHHKRIAREVGLTDSLIAAATGGTAAGLDDAQRLALKMVDELIADKQLSQATFDKAIKDYGVRTVVDMILMVGFYTMACMYMKSFGIEIEQPPK